MNNRSLEHRVLKIENQSHLKDYEDAAVLYFSSWVFVCIKAKFLINKSPTQVFQKKIT